VTRSRVLKVVVI